jgi:hypothetical protein
VRRSEALRASQRDRRDTMPTANRSSEHPLERNQPNEPPSNPGRFNRR